MATRRIVVGVDGSIGSAAAVAWCAGMAPLLDAEIIAVHAIETRDLYAAPANSSPTRPEVNDGRREQLRTRIEKVWCKALEAAGIGFRVVLLDVAAAAALLAVADDVDADIIVVGRRGHGGFEELLLGSAPHQVAQHAQRPVAIVPSG